MPIFIDIQRLHGPWGLKLKVKKIRINLCDPRHWRESQRKLVQPNGATTASRRRKFQKRKDLTRYLSFIESTKSAGVSAGESKERTAERAVREMTISVTCIRTIYAMFSRGTRTWYLISVKRPTMSVPAIPLNYYLPWQAIGPCRPIAHGMLAYSYFFSS